MQVKPLSAPPIPSSGLTWRGLYLDGRFEQRHLVDVDQLRRDGEERGLFIGLGREHWMEWDEYGALCPVAFGLDRWNTDQVLDPNDSDTIGFREEQPFKPWRDYAVDRWGYPTTTPLYTPWQLLPLHDVQAGLETEVSVPVMLDPRKRARWVKQLRTLLEGQWQAWRTFDARWQPTLRLLVAIQNRFWPPVSGRVVLGWDPVTDQRRDPFDPEVRSFDPLRVLGHANLREEELAATYEWLCTRGAQVEGGRNYKTLGGDRLARLRLLADRRERRRLRGPSRTAMDFYEAAEMIGRFWFEMTGRYLPSIDTAPHRRSTIPIDHVATSEPTHARTPEALREQLRAHGLWPGKVHVVVEGDSEVIWVRRLVEALLGHLPADLVMTNLRGVGGASRMQHLVETIADYATSSALILDNEGEIARYARELMKSGRVDSRDVHLVDTSFEEANFADRELVETVAYLAANPPGQRPRCHLRLSAEELRSKHQDVTRKAKKGMEPGLAETLLRMTRNPVHGPVQLKKTELNEALIDRVVDELRDEGVRQVVARRPIVRFVVDRIADELINSAWR